MINRIVPGNPHIAPSTLLGRDPATSTPRPNLDDIGTAATAMAWVMQGELQMARTKLRRLSPPMLREVALAAEVVRGAAAAMAAITQDTEPMPTVDDGMELPAQHGTIPEHARRMELIARAASLPGAYGYSIGGATR